MPARVSGLKLSYSAIGEQLRSPGLMSALKAKGDGIASAMTAEGHGEFRAFEGDNSSRARTFVNAYDRHAKRAANIDPAIFNRHLGG